jgi:hypothetical protein
MLTPNAKRAVVRRVLLVGGTLLAITFALWQRSELYRVEVVDFASKQQEEPGWTGHRQVSLQDYVADRTEGRLLHKVGQAWLDLYADVAAARPYRFFLPDQTPWNELAGAFDGEFTYVAVPRDGQIYYLGVDVSRSGDFPAAPARLRYPLRWLALWIFLAGLLGYVLIPWPRDDPNAVAYARLTCALVPDLALGIMLTGVFYVVPWFVVPSQAHASHPLVVEGGWMILTVVMWGLAFFGLAIHVTAIWYEVLRLHVADDHLLMESLWRRERIAFADIDGVELGVREPSKVLVKMGMLVSLFNRRALGPTLLLASRRDRVIELVLRDGRRRRFGLLGIRHLDCLISSLRQAGVSVDPDLASQFSR